MNNSKEVFDRDCTEESIVDMDGLSGGSDAGDSTGSPGSRFKVDTTTATGEPIEVGSPILSTHSVTISSSAVPPPPYSPDVISGLIVNRYALQATFFAAEPPLPVD